MEIQEILRNLQIAQLTPMQEAVREVYRENKDLVLLSPTGSGKTLAFLLPLVQSLKGCGLGTFARIGVTNRNSIQVYGNAVQGNELLRWPSGDGRTPHDAWYESRSHHRHTGTDERPFEEG